MGKRSFSRQLRYRTRWVGVLSLLGLIGCSEQAWVSQVGPQIDALARAREEFGSGTISSPVLAKPDDAFKFNLNRGADQYFSDAKTQLEGGAAALDLNVQSLALGATVAADPTQALAYGLQLQQLPLQQQLYQRQLLTNEFNQEFLNQVAREQYRADLAAASKETDPAKRATAISDARTNFIAATKADTVTTPAIPTAKTDGTNVPTPPTDVAKEPTGARAALPNDGKLLGYKGLLGSSFAPHLSDRAALYTSAGDTAVEAIFRVLGDPQKLQQFKDKTMFFGVSTVSVNPGWRTRKGYAADVSVRTRFEYHPAGISAVKAFLQMTNISPEIRQRVAKDFGLSVGDDPGLKGATPVNDLDVIPEWWKAPDNALRREGSPLVAAVSPINDSQVLDLGNSQRQQNEFALSLAGALRAAGFEGQAQVFEQYVHSHQRDTETLTNSITVSTYSNPGGVFGFQVGPRLRAIEDPGVKKSEQTANVLDRQSFPVLVLLGFDHEDVRLRLDWVKNRDRDGWRLVLFRPTIVFTSSTWWLPLDGNQAVVREQDRLDMEMQLANASSVLTKELEPVNEARAHVDEIESEIRELRSHLENRPAAQNSSAATESEYVSTAQAKLKEASKRLDKAIQAVPPEDALAYAKHRLDTLQNYVFANKVSEQIPLEFLDVSAPSTPAAKPTAILPATITLTRKNDAPEAKDVQVVIAGDDLSSVDLDKIRVVLGNAEVAADAAGASGPARSRFFAGNAICLKITVKGDDAPIVFALPLKNDAGNPATTVAFPIQVSVAPPDKPGAKAVTIKRNLEEDGKPKSSEALEFGPGASDGQIHAAESIFSQKPATKPATPKPAEGNPQ